MAEKMVTLEQVSVPAPGGALMLHSIDLSIHQGEQWAILGSSGSGKTVLAHTLLGRHFYQGRIISPAHGLISIVEQQHRFLNLSGTSDLYYQQRFNSYDSEQTITVEQKLRQWGMPDDNSVLDTLHVRQLLSKPLIQLSNGENKRVQLAIALSGDPALLILDNPFVGLDTGGRMILHKIINLLSERGLAILLITSAREIPETITHIARLEKGRLSWAGPKADFASGGDLAGRSAILRDPQAFPARLQQLHLPFQQLPSQLQQPPAQDFSIAVKLVDTCIRYGETTILNDINWEVKKGERWSLSGPNGAGKSTILSLITADNPQAYANEIWLFDRKRGSGESIWDIKRRIGFVSPELHLYFDHQATCFEVVASGLFDTIGLFRRLSTEQENSVRSWLEWLSLAESGDRRLFQLSIGQQRMVLLARALIKNPSLLILDEPCQGLDDEQTIHFSNLINGLCETFATTLIFVSHYPDDTPACVNNFLRIENGMVASRQSM